MTQNHTPLHSPQKHQKNLEKQQKNKILEIKLKQIPNNSLRPNIQKNTQANQNTKQKQNQKPQAHIKIKKREYINIQDGTTLRKQAT